MIKKAYHQIVFAARWIILALHVPHCVCVHSTVHPLTYKDTTKLEFAGIRLKTRILVITEVSFLENRFFYFSSISSRRKIGRQRKVELKAARKSFARLRYLKTKSSSLPSALPSKAKQITNKWPSFTKFSKSQISKDASILLNLHFICLEQKPS